MTLSSCEADELHTEIKSLKCFSDSDYVILVSPKTLTFQPNLMIL